MIPLAIKTFMLNDIKKLFVVQETTYTNVTIIFIDRYKPATNHMMF